MSDLPIGAQKSAKLPEGKEHLASDFAIAKPSRKPASLDDLFTFKTNPVTNPNRPGWELNMDVNISYNEGLLESAFFEDSDKQKINDFMQNFRDIDLNEFQRLPEDVKHYLPGIRTYTVDLAKDSVAGAHYHRLKKEIFTVKEGAFLVKLEDVFGNKKEQQIDRTTGMIVLPFISHEIIGVAPQSILKVLANCAYKPEDYRTNDTWTTVPALAELQKHYKHS